MARFSSFALPGVLLLAAVGALACGSDGGTAPAPRTGIVFIAGDGGTDTVSAPRIQALVVEVRDSIGRPQPQVNVQFRVGAPADSTREYELGLALCSAATTACDATNAFLTRARAELTNDLGRASVVVHHSSVAGPVWVHVYVPELGLRDSTRFTTLPGRLAEIRPSVRDTTIRVGVTFPLTLATYDRFGNALGPAANSTITAGSARVQVRQNIVTGVATGRSFVVHRAGTVLDTTWVSVVPTGRLALSRYDGVVVSNFDGTDARTYTGVSGGWQYGLRPRWVPGGARIIVHSETGNGIRLQSIDAATGLVTTLPTSPVIAAQYYPDPTANWLYFNAYLTNGTYRMWRMRLDGTGIEQAPGTSPAYSGYYRGALSPDGSKLVVSVIEAGSVGVRVFDAVTGVAISPFFGNATSPVWSPDGQWVAYSTPYSGPLRVMRADGSQAREIGSAAFGEWFDWSNDGEWLVGSHQGGVALVRVSDGEIVPLGLSYDAWQPAVQR